MANPQETATALAEYGKPAVTAEATMEGTMTTFTVRLPRWPVLLRLWGRDPLVRTVDRIDAVILVLAVGVSLLAVPVAAAAGTALHDSRRDHYAGQAATRSLVIATITDVPSFPDGPPHGATTVQGRWAVGGTEHTGALAAPATAEIGDPVEIWIDNNSGAWVPAPTSTARAAVEAVITALAIWAGTVGAAMVLYLMARTACNRTRLARWQRGLDDLVDHPQGQARGNREDRNDRQEGHA